MVRSVLVLFCRANEKNVNHARTDNLVDNRTRVVPHSPLPKNYQGHLYQYTSDHRFPATAVVARDPKAQLGEYRPRTPPTAAAAAATTPWQQQQHHEQQRQHQHQWQSKKTTRWIGRDRIESVGARTANERGPPVTTLLACLLAWKCKRRSSEGIVPPEKKYCAIHPSSWRKWYGWSLCTKMCTVVAQVKHTHTHTRTTEHDYKHV